ncbi:MAG: prepilin-type N-terminal cleavage/methylation domain-containing protein [Dethiobacteraceae bacterium]
MLNLLRKAKNQKGFTLVELMVVVVIIGVLVAIAIPIYNTGDKKGRAWCTRRLTYEFSRVQDRMWFAENGPPAADGTDITTDLIDYVEGGSLPTVPGVTEDDTNDDTVTIDINGTVHGSPDVGKRIQYMTRNRLYLTYATFRVTRSLCSLHTGTTTVPSIARIGPGNSSAI